ncbi:hypothetical protein DPMN_015184 [Dreissena polymorpha]|uniref:Uncharacterized protein n=1 Tax=Dreissena polymorpha TaxID=45954 RepID=A0A9D4N8P7_DREPO|nr:hypothetical protein DPMN_015184 [Dreissena polymorpha]
MPHAVENILKVVEVADELTLDFLDDGYGNEHLFHLHKQYHTNVSRRRRNKCKHY